MRSNGGSRPACRNEAFFLSRATLENEASRPRRFGRDAKESARKGCGARYAKAFIPEISLNTSAAPAVTLTVPSPAEASKDGACMRP